jgi:hypothetical protein
MNPPIGKPTRIATGQSQTRRAVLVQSLCVSQPQVTLGDGFRHSVLHVLPDHRRDRTRVSAWRGDQPVGLSLRLLANAKKMLAGS